MELCFRPDRLKTDRTAVAIRKAHFVHVCQFTLPLLGRSTTVQESGREEEEEDESKLVENQKCAWVELNTWRLESTVIQTAG
jgi:hypothetical protein